MIFAGFAEFHLTNHGYFDHGRKPEYPQLEAHAGVKMA